MSNYLIKKPFADIGDKTTVPVAKQSDGKVSMEEGFGLDYERDLDANDPKAKEIQRGVLNYLLNQITGALAAMQRNGVDEYKTGQTYGKSAMVWYNGELYISQTNNNTTAPTSSGWKSLTSLLAAGGGKIMLGPRYDWRQRGGNERQGWVLVSWADFGGSNYWTYHRPLYYWSDGKWVLTPIGNV